MLASAILLAALLTGCDLFLTKPENDLLSEVDDALDYTNAAVLPVSVDEGGMGTAVPRGSIVGVKQGYPFTLSYTAKTEYPFLGWQAQIEGSSDIISMWEPGGSAGLGITWESVNTTGTEIRVTIHINPGKTILIGPLKASMPFVNVTVEDVSSGVSTPGGVLAGVKQDIPFSLRFNPYPAFGFIGWEATLDGVPLGQEEVEFSNPKGMDITVTVHKDPEAQTVIIKPRAEGNSDAYGFTVVGPSTSTGTDITHNHYFQIRFTKPIDPASLWFEDNKNYTGAFVNSSIYESWAINAANFTRAYRNISIRGTVNPPWGQSNIRFENFFNPPVLSADGKVLTFWMRCNPTTGIAALDTYKNSVNGNAGTAASPINIDVTVDGQIKDTSGLPMGAAKSWSYSFNMSETPGRTPPNYGEGNIFPNMWNGATFLLLKKDSEDYKSEDLYGTDPVLSIAANSGVHDAYVVFQSNYTQWEVAGIRVLYNASPTYRKSNSPEFNSDFDLIEDGPLRQKIVAAYKEKYPSFYSEMPVYVAAFRIPENTTGKMPIVVLARVMGEQALSNNYSSFGSSYTNLGTNVNRKSYGSPPYAGAFLSIQYN
ncbi:hypothetical protein LQZ19_17285 [Treponema primitia]|uniref:hypothetical protein n=1 Tax=Treponema primitia TaxID=88058 RepID=UPI0039802B1C